MVVMPRQLSIDYPGAIHHSLCQGYGGTSVMSRGDRREDIYHDDVDRERVSPRKVTKRD